MLKILLVGVLIVFAAGFYFDQTDKAAMNRYQDSGVTDENGYKTPEKDGEETFIRQDNGQVRSCVRKGNVVDCRIIGEDK